MNKEALASWLSSQQPKLESILLSSAQEYYNNNSKKNVFSYDLKQTSAELWLLGQGKDLCYDRPTIGFSYALWFHPKRINTFLKYFADLLFDCRYDDSIEIFDLGAGTGAVLWAVGLVSEGLKTLNLPCPKIRVVNIDTSAFMLDYGQNYLWNNFIKEYPNAGDISKPEDYKLTSWTNLYKKSHMNVWLCASYLFDHSENIEAVGNEFKKIVEEYKPNKVLLLSSIQKRTFVDTVAQVIKRLDYSSYNQVLKSPIFNGGLPKLTEFRNSISEMHALGLIGGVVWDIDKLYGQVLINEKPVLMGLTLDNLSLSTLPESDRSKVKLTDQQTDAAAVTGRPTIIFGPAGCGKSVVLTQKVIEVVNAAKIGNQYDPNLRILVTTYNKDLVRYLGDCIEQLLEQGKFRRVFDSWKNKKKETSYFTFSNSSHVNIFVIHFDVIPTKIGLLKDYDIRLNGEKYEQFHYTRMQSAIDSYVEKNKINRKEFETILNPEFLLDEYHRVIFGYECNSQQQYLSVERTGRGNKPQLKEARRKIAWGVITFYLRALQKNQPRLESFIIRRHRLIKEWRVNSYKSKFSHVFVDEFQDCTKSDFEIFYHLLANPNNLTLTGDIAQSINLGPALHIPRSDDPIMGNFSRKKLDGSFRLPFRVSECLRPFSQSLNKKFGAREGVQPDIISPYKGAPPGSRPILVYALDETSAVQKVREIFYCYDSPLKLDQISIFEEDTALAGELNLVWAKAEAVFIQRKKGLERKCVLWSTRIRVDTKTEKEEFVYTIMTRTISLLIILVFPDIDDDYKNIIRLLDKDRLIIWDDETEAKYNEIAQVAQASADQDDLDTSEDTQVINDDDINEYIL